MQQTVKEKDSFQSWVVCLICLFVNVIVGGIGSAFQILTPTLEDYFDESPSLISFIGSLNMGMWFILDPAAAWLFQKFGIRTTYMIGSLIAGTAAIASAFSPSAQIMVLLYGLITGTGLACIELMAVIACDTSFEKRRAMASSIARGGIGIGAFVLPPLVNFILTKRDWKYVIYTYSALFFVPFLIGCLTLCFDHLWKKKNTDEEKYRLIDRKTSNSKYRKYQSGPIRQIQTLNLDLLNDSKENHESPGVSEEIALLLQAEEPSYNQRCSICYHSCDTCDECIKRDFSDYTEIQGSSFLNNGNDMQEKFRERVQQESFAQKCIQGLKSSLLWNPIFLLVMIGKFFGSVAYFTVTIFFASILLEKGFTLTEASTIASVVGVTGIVGSIVFGILTDKTKLDALTMSCITMGLMCLTTLSITFTNHHELLWVFSVCNGFVRNTFMSLGSVLMFDILPYEDYPKAVAYSGVFQGIATIAGPPFAGYFFSISQSYTITFCISSGSALLCAILYSIADVMNVRKKTQFQA